MTSRVMNRRQFHSAAMAGTATITAGAPFVFAAEKRPLMAGAAETVVTPAAEGTFLIGPMKPSTGVNGDLYARALVLAEGDKRIAIVTLDYLGFDFGFTRVLLTAASKASGIPTDHIMLNCSHTHSAPLTAPWGPWKEHQDQPFYQMLPKKVAEVVRRACDKLQPARLRYRREPTQIGFNRRLFVPFNRVPNGPRASDVEPTRGPMAARLNEAALMLSRWHRQPMGAPVRHGSSISTTGNAYTTGGDHGYGTALANHIWSNLANRALTNDVAERQIAESMLAFFLEDLELHHRIAQPTGYIYDYQADTPLAHWPGEAILDAWLQTGEPRWKDAAMRLGEALVVLQNESGGFCNPRSLKGDKRFGPQGYFTWRVGNTEFGAAELLYLLGRIRRDLKTDAFVEAETKAYNWVMKHGVRERFWPINVCHSMSGGYPIWQHAVTALYFSRYLLECAPPDRRDLKLAEEVARWAEDTGIDWHRAAEGPQSDQITPHVNRIDRYNNEPMASNMLAAIVFEELSQATENPLWSAKAEALATAVLQAQHPQSGHSNTGLEPKAADHDSRQFNDAKFRHWDFSRGWTAQMLREYATLRGK